jgi:hypothetical protein
MKLKTMFFYLLGTLSLTVAVILFFKWLDLRFLIPLGLVIAAVVFFWIGSPGKRKLP